MLARWFLMIGFTATLQAQSAPQTPDAQDSVGRFIHGPAPRSSLLSVADSKVETDPRIGSVAPEDHRWEGGAMGAFVVGALGYRYARATCNGDSGTGSCLGYHISRTVVGALIGGIMGLFIGSSIPKHRLDPAAP